jgi:hypothetical protein
VRITVLKGDLDLPSVLGLAAAALLAMLAAAGSALAVGPPAVTLSPSGPTPTTISARAGEPILFLTPLGASPSRIVFNSAPCDPLILPALGPCPVLELPPPNVTVGCDPSADCLVGTGIQLWDLGSFSYQVSGFGAGTGRVVVTPNGHLTAVPDVVTFGNRVRLGGYFGFANAFPPFSPPRTRIGVTVLARSLRQDAYAPIGATVTIGGYWSARARPLIETTYRISWVESDWASSWDRVRSEGIMVRVRPKVTLEEVARRTFIARVKALSSYAGKRANVQRLVRGTWTTIATLSLDRHSRATFNLSGLPGGSRIRVLVPLSQAQPGYVAGFSRSLRLAQPS